MTLILLSLLAALFFSFQALFLKLYTNSYPERGREKAGSVFTILYGLVIALISFTAGGCVFSPTLPTLLFALMNGGLLLLYNISMINAGSKGSYSFMMISSLTGGILVPVAVGALFFEERLSGIQVLAVALMLAALVITNGKGLTLRGNSGKYYMWCGLLFLANGLYSAVMDAQATVMDGREHAEMLVMLFFFSSCFALIREWIAGRGAGLAEGFQMGRQSLLFALICCISASAGANLMLYLFSQMESGVLCAIVSGGTLVLSVIYAFVLFRERPDRWQLAGILFAAVSMILINQSLA